MNSLDQTRLANLQAQLQMAQTRYPVSKIQVALLQAKIKELQDHIRPVEPVECYSPHTIIIEDVSK
jgi:ribosomal protein S15P/S13E